MNRTLASRWLFLIPVLLGGALRFYQARSCYDVYMPGADQEEEYYEAGMAVSSYHVLAKIPDVNPTAFRPPIYPVFIAMVEAPFSHPRPGHVRMAQALLSTLSIIAIFALGRWLLSPLAGFLAATCFALDPDQIMAVSSLNVHGFYGICVLGLGIAVLFWLENRSAAATIALGAILSSSLLCRAAHFPFPVFLGAVYLFWWRFPEDRWRKMALLAAATVLFLSPMTIRNALQFRKFIPFDHKGSYMLLRSTVGGSVETSAEQSIDVAETLQPGFKNLDLSWDDLHATLISLALRNIRAHPFRYAWFCLERLASFWRGLWLFLLLAFAALKGNPENKGLQALAVVAASFCGYAVAGGAPQYRVSVLPILDVLAGCGLATLAARWTALKAGGAAGGRSKETGHWSLYAVLGCGALLYLGMIYFLSLELRDRWWPSFRSFPGAASLYNDGRAAEVLGLAASSAKGDDIAVRLYADALVQDAEHWRALNSPEKAEADLKKAEILELKLKLDDDKTFASACDLMIAKGRSQEAFSYADRRVRASARASGPRRAAALRQRARILLALKEPAKAEGDLREAARIDPGNAEGMKSLAEILFEGGEERDARLALDKVVALSSKAKAGPEYLKLTEGLSPLLFRAGLLPQALGMADRRVTASGNDDPAELSRALAERGMIEVELKSFDKAGQDFEQAWRLAPAAPELALSVAQVLYHGGKPEQALAMLAGHDSTLAAAAAPLRAQWLASRGVVRSSLGDAPGARADLAAAIAIDARAACLQGLEFEYRGRLSADYLDQCVERFPNEVSLRSDRGGVRLAAGDAEGAVADFRAALSLKPDSAEAAMSLADALWQRARQLLERKELAKAEDGLREAARIDPGNAEGMKNLAEVLFDRGEDRDARSALDKAAAIVSRAKSASEFLRVSGGMVPLLVRAGRLPEALDVADRRLAMLSQAGSAALTRALDERDEALGSACDLLLKQGRAREALVYADRRVSALARAAAPRRAAALRQRAQLLLALKEPAKAEDDLREAARIDPGDAEGMKSFAEILFERGEDRDARLALDRAVSMVSRAKSASEYLPMSSRLVPLLVRVGRLQEALGVENRRLALVDGAGPAAFSRVLAERGMIEAQLKAFDKAGQDFERALGLTPASPELALSAAGALYRGGKPERALSVLVDRASALAGAAPPLRARWLASRGAVRSRLGDAAGAKADWADAMAADARTACLRGPELEDRGRLSAAYFDACVGRFPNEASLRLDRGVVRFAAGDLPGAESDFRAALRLKPDSAEAAMSLETVLKGRKAASP